MRLSDTSTKARPRTYSVARRIGDDRDTGADRFDHRVLVSTVVDLINLPNRSENDESPYDNLW